MATAKGSQCAEETQGQSLIAQEQKQADEQAKDKAAPVEPEALDGGWGWVVVGAAFVIYVIVFGTLRCQSVLFVPIMEEYDALYSSVGWVTALATLGFAFAGILSAPLMAKFGHRTAAMVGGVVACLSYVIAVFAPSLAVLDVFAGFLAGVGLGISFVCAPVLVGFYFKKRRALATNIASIGGSTGTFIVCPLNGFLISIYGLRGYLLIMAAVFLNLSVAGALMRPISLSMRLAKGGSPKAKGGDSEMRVVEQNDKQDENNEKALIEQEVMDKPAAAATKPWTSLLRSPAYIVYCISQLIFLAGFIVNQLYIVPFAEIELGVSPLQAPLIMSIAAATEVFSRIGFGILGDIQSINRVLMFAAVLAVLAVCGLIVPLTNSFESLAAMAAVSGLFQGGFSGISVVILADIVGLKLYGPALGISTFINGIGTLLSPPLVGLAVDSTKKPSTALFIGAGILMLGAFMSFMIQVALNYEKRKLKKIVPRRKESKRSVTSL